MLKSYGRFLKRSFTDSFKKEEYRRYWNVPSSERLVKVGLPAGCAVGVLFIILTLIKNQVVAAGVFVFMLVFVIMPLLQVQAEKLKDKYSK